MILLLVAAGFAIWMIIDCATRELETGDDKVVWILIIALTHILGGLIYYFIRHRPRRFAEWQRAALPYQR